MSASIDYGRALMGDSLGFHILFALLGVGLPLAICLAELIGILRKDAHFTQMAKRWTFALSALFVSGAVSGTIISFQFNLIWPGFMEFAGPIIGLPMSLEGYAFFVEAIFLGIYVFSWKRLSPWQHWLTSIPIVVGSAASAFFITTVNSFMNNPQGFVLKDGRVADINPWKAMLNPATPTETSHSIAAYYATTFLVIAAIAAYSLLRKPSPGVAKYHKKVLLFGVSIGLVCALLVGATGDRSGKYLAVHEPLKLAAAEGLHTTQSHAPLTIAGVTIPGALSFLAFNSTSATVKGLDSFNPAHWPSPAVRYFFDVMVIIGSLMVGLPALFLLLYWRKPTLAFSPWILRGVMLSGLLGFIAVEAGWMLTEMGRQPWVVRDFLKTEQAFTTANNVEIYGFIFPTLYLMLFIISYLVIRRFYAKRPINE